MRIVAVASGREWRGGQHQVLLLATGLAATGIEIVVVTGGDTLLAERLRAADVAVEPVHWSAGLDPRVMLRLMARLDRDTIAHAHDSHAHAMVDVAARFRHAPVVVTRPVALPIRHGARYRRSAAVIAISEAVRTEVLAAGVAPSRIHVIPPAVDLARISTTPAPAGTAPLVVTVAALTPEKGVDLLLRAAAELHGARRDVRWKVLGDGPERGRLEAERAALGLERVVEFAGFVTEPERILAGATIAVQPSRQEGFGMAVLMAMAQGVPVVATAVGGLPEALSGGGGVLVQRDDPSALAAAIMKLLDDPVERTRLGAAAIHAARQFGVDRMVERTVAVYRSVMNTDRSS